MRFWPKRRPPQRAPARDHHEHRRHGPAEGDSAGIRSSARVPRGRRGRQHGAGSNSGGTATPTLSCCAGRDSVRRRSPRPTGGSTRSTDFVIGPAADQRRSRARRSAREASPPLAIARSRRLRAAETRRARTRLNSRSGRPREVTPSGARYRSSGRGWGDADRRQRAVCLMSEPWHVAVDAREAAKSPRCCSAAARIAGIPTRACATAMA